MGDALTAPMPAVRPSPMSTNYECHGRVGLDDVPQRFLIRVLRRVGNTHARAMLFAIKDSMR